MKKVNLVILGAVLLLPACSKQNYETFTVKGQVIEAEGKTLYFDNMGLTSIVPVDSVKLDADGNFSFSAKRPELFDFYRLRVADQVVNLAVDSTETITVNAALPSMSVAYTVEGSEDCAKLRELVMKQITLQQEIKLLVASVGPERGILSRKVNELVDVCKSEIKNGYIFPDPSKPYAYYSLFLRINGTPLFSPQSDRQDAKCFAAVATSLDMKNDSALRSQNLHNIALKAMKSTSTARTSVSEEILSHISEITSESGLIDIDLPDYKGISHKLSDLKGKVVLLDFTAFKTDFSAAYNLTLREFYDKYAAQGFEIYQVSLDADEHFWITGAENLPWICVHDENSLQSQYVGSYQIASLPTAFLIGRDGEIKKRLTDVKELDADIAALLAQ